MKHTQHNRAVRVDAAYRDRVDEQRSIHLGVIRWCLQLIADESPLHSPSLEPGRSGSDSSPTERAALNPDPDPLLGAAEAVLAWVDEGKDWNAARAGLRAIKANVPPERLSRPCAKCGEAGEQMRGDLCKRCDQSARRERERVA